jgi:natural product precursor
MIMKKNLKLNVLAAKALSDTEMNQVRGGDIKCCSCGCQYAGQGGSGTHTNKNANFDRDIHTQAPVQAIRCAPGDVIE